MYSQQVTLVVFQFLRGQIHRLTHAETRTHTDTDTDAKKTTPASDSIAGVGLQVTELVVRSKTIASANLISTVRL